MDANHGGDWAAYELEYGALPLDFSASLSPLGMPETVCQAAAEAVQKADRYPDPYSRRLRAALSARHGVPPEQIVCGAGAADLIDRLRLNTPACCGPVIDCKLYVYGLSRNSRRVQPLAGIPLSIYVGYIMSRYVQLVLRCK